MTLNPKSVVVQIVFYSVMIIMLFGFLAAGTVFFISRNSLISELSESNLVRIATLEKNASAIFDNSKSLSQILAQEEPTIEYLQQYYQSDIASESASPSTMAASTLSNFYDHYFPEFHDALYLMDLQGNTTVSTDITFLNQNYAHRPYFQEAIETGQGVYMAVGTTSRKPGYYFSHLVVDADQQPLGVMVVKLNASYVETQIIKGHTDNQERFLMVDQSGVIIGSNDPAVLYNTVAELSEEKKSELIEEQRFPGISTFYDIGLTDLFMAISNYTQPTTITLQDNRVGVKKMFHLQQIGDYPYFLILENRYDLITKDAQYLAVSISFFVFLAAASASILISVLIGNFLQPLKKYIDVAREISQGNFDTPLPKAKSAEWITLSSAIKSMSDDLEVMYSDLDRKVKEKTVDLKKFKLAIEHASDQIVISDAEGIVLYGNPALERITGYSPQEALHQKAGKLWGGLMSAEYYRDLWQQIKHDKQTYVGEIRNKKKNGQEYEAEIKVSPILDEDGEVLYFVAIERDITELKRIDRMKSDFITIASHQLRTPLTAIKWLAETLKDDATQLNQEQLQMIDDIYLSNDRMIKLVNSLLSISKIETGQVKARLVTTDLVTVVEDAIHEVNLLYHHLSYDLSFSNKPESLMVLVDTQLFTQSLINLLSNAIEYATAKLDKNHQPKITISLEKRGDQVEVHVEDNGIGIPIDDQPFIFDKFFRANNARALDTDGNGLGLYLVKMIITEMNGQISFQSKENIGSTFTITLPLKLE